MRTFRSAKARGFTLVELMIVVAIIGVLAALAIYGVRRYLATAKSSEAKNTIGAINRGAIAAYERESVSSEALTEGSTSTTTTHSLCATSTSVPDATTKIQGVKYQPNTAANQDYNAGTAQTGWPCLKFSMSDPQYYQYTYTKGANGTNLGQQGTIITVPGTGWQSGAVGDLDGDTVLSAFATGGDVNATTKEAKAFSQVGEFQPDELSASPGRELNPGARTWPPGLFV